MTVTVAVVGDYQSGNETHLATDAALGHAADSMGLDVDVRWIGTDTIGSDARQIHDVDAIFVAPGSPYRSMQGALAAIGYARAHSVALLATCGGFQHTIIEYARVVLGIEDAQHAEVDPYASTLFITPLSCSLAGREMDIEFATGSRVADAYGATRATERYYCNFGLNPDYRSTLDDGHLAMSGVDTDNEVRVVELTDHPFFVGTLFVPQTSSLPDAPHPLLRAFLAASAS